MHHPVVDAATLNVAAIWLLNKGVEENLPALGQAALAVRRHGLAVDDKILTRMIDHPAVEQRDLRNLAAVLARPCHSEELSVCTV